MDNDQMKAEGIDEVEALHVDNTGDDVQFEDVSEDGELAKADPQSKLKQLREKLAACEKQKQEYLDGWQRSKADYVNLKKRTDDEKMELAKFAREGFVADLIPTIESFDMAFANKEAWEKVEPNWRAGVEYIHRQFMETLSGYGFAEVNPLGATFDPQHFTAVANVPTDDPTKDHTVAEVVQKGYKLGDKLIRSPKVKVYTAQQ